MSTVAKIFAFIVAVAAIAFASASFVMVKKTQNYSDLLDKEKIGRAEDVASRDKTISGLQKLLKDAEDARDRATEQAKTVQSNLGTAQATIADLNQKLADAQKANDQLSANVKGIQDRLKQLADENKQLMADKETWRAERDKALEDMKRAQDERKVCQEDLMMANKSIQELSDKLREKEGVIGDYKREAPEVKFSAKPLTMPDIKGKVLKVDAEKGIAMINVGKDDGVKDGFSFEVFREGQYVGRLWVQQIFDEQTICRIDPTMTKPPIMENDNVATRLAK